MKSLLALAIAGGLPMVASGGRDVEVFKISAQPIPFDDDFYGKPEVKRADFKKRPQRASGTAAAKRAAKKKRNRK